jgi:hypothetical protein
MEGPLNALLRGNIQRLWVWVALRHRLNNRNLIVSRQVDFFSDRLDDLVGEARFLFYLVAVLNEVIGFLDRVAQLAGARSGLEINRYVGGFHFIHWHKNLDRLTIIPEVERTR